MSRSLPPDAECDCHQGGPDIALQESPGDGWSDLAFRSEIRAVEQGHRAFVLYEREETARFTVVSHCRHSRRYEVIIDLRPGTTLPAFGHCLCEAGVRRGGTYPVPCKHAALACRSLERRKKLVWHDGLWWAPGVWEERVRRRKARVVPDDPFEGLVDEPEAW